MSEELDSAMNSINTLLDMDGGLLAVRDQLRVANAELVKALEVLEVLLAHFLVTTHSLQDDANLH